jgi:hypothetical protein
MRIILFLCLALLLPLKPAASSAGKATGSSPSETPSYTADGRMLFPERFREWIFLTSDLDMSYNPGMQMSTSTFGNVFVNPAAYRVYQATGTWPDKTVLVLEHHVAGGNSSINKAGHFQAAALSEIEIHVKDSRFSGRWAFFSFSDNNPAKEIQHSASCYSCHAQHGAVDNTFVQFYPTLIEVAKAKGTYQDR